MSAATAALSPPGETTRTSTLPDPAGAVAVICVSLFTVNVAAVEPNRTFVALARCVPVITTDVPTGPDATDSPEITGSTSAGCSSTEPMSVPSLPGAFGYPGRSTGRVMSR